MAQNRYFIGLDDTDHGDSIGTGALSRELMVHLQREAAAKPMGITRHQFLIHPDIPYTSHNSSACLEIEAGKTREELSRICGRFISFLFHPGADPGVCIASSDQLTEKMLAFGQRAQKEVVTKDEAILIAREAGVYLEEFGGEGIGVIGALGGCSLRLDGNDGRFIQHRGLREVGEEMSAARILDRTAVEKILDPEGVQVPSDAVITTNNWVRPDLENGSIVLRVDRNNDGALFIRKKKKGVDDM